MRAIGTYILILAGCLGPWALAQEGDTTALGLRFYEKLAQRDALYEQSMRFLDEEDATDYWSDQRNFERQLQQKNPRALAAYLTGKQSVYLNHLQHCTDQCGHEYHYQRQALYFLEYPQAENYELTFSNYKLGKRKKGH
ncbi:MAG: hypothetical protein R2819_07435 [Allomuricauda sp.]